ncbi:MAG TPA: DUF1349 domain-containing protein [Candidatus Sulfotelmatobacter sp.]|nr:DUF1349 domain-containing protein [Candidatus Sulfotelmatobacter sp.]
MRSFKLGRHGVVTVLIGFALAAGAAAQSAAPSSGVRDSPDWSKLPKLPGGWTLLNKEKGDVTATDKGLRIVPATDTNLFVAPRGTENVVNAPMVLFAPEGDFTLKAKISAQLIGIYDVGALVVFADEQHWAKLCFENSPRHEASVVTVVTRERSDDANSETIASPFVYMAIARRGNEYTMHFSRDGQQWRLARHFQLLATAKVRVGFTAHTESNPHLAAEFSEIVYRDHAPRNMRQLELADDSTP